MATAPTVSHDLFAGRYALEKAIGSGASATVHLARDTQNGRSVALKILRPELVESTAKRRFLAEIRRTSRLEHQFIVPVLDSGEHEGRLYCALPYMEGGSLRQLLKREKHFPLDRVLAIAGNVAQALDYAHAQGLIHRDVKPENILFAKGVAHLADFGIARALALSGSTESSTSRNTVRGTPAYMSPEQAAGGTDLDGRSDVYSLACVVYEMISGMQAFIGPTPESVIAQRFAFAPREVRVYRPTVPAAVDKVLARAFEISPTDRFDTAVAFVDALRVATESAGPPVPIPGPRERFRGTARVATAAVIVVAIAALAVREVRGRSIERAISAADTTSYFLLEVAGARDTATALEVQSQLRDALRSWSGLAIAEAPPGGRGAGSQKAALEAGSGRIIEPVLERAGDLLRLRLRDLTSAAPLTEHDVRLAGGPAERDAAIAAGVDSLLLKQLALPGGRPGSRNVRALNLFAAGYEELRAWRLESSDSLFEHALDADETFARAALWQAQARAWNDEPAERWRLLAARASMNATNERERILALALLAMADKRFEDACSHYSALEARDSMDFVGWFGLGECRRRDQRVVPSRGSRSGWRFASSGEAAVRAYMRALELAPVTHHGFHPQGYEKLKNILHVDVVTTLRPGYAPDRSLFLAYGELDADTLAFVPYPASAMFSGGTSYDNERIAAAANRGRERFRKVVSSWSATLRENAAVKEGVAISLAIAGDPSAVDTLMLARSLGTTRSHRTTLAVQEVLVRLEFAKNDPEKLSRVRELADSLLRAHRRPSVELAPIAVLRGRCSWIRDLDERGESNVAPTESGSHLRRIAANLTILAAMNCDADALQARIDSLVRAAMKPEWGSERRDAEERALLGRLVPLLPRADSAMLERHRAAGDYLWMSLLSLRRGDTADVRARLERIRARRGPARQREVSPDAVLPEARLLLAIGDTARAVDWLESAIIDARWFEKLNGEPVNVAALLQGLALRTALAGATDAAGAQWGATVRTLWADGERGPAAVARLRQRQ